VEEAIIFMPLALLYRKTLENRYVSIVFIIP